MAGESNDAMYPAVDPSMFHYVSAYDMCLSPCKKYLVVATNYGIVYLFNLQAALTPEISIHQETDFRRSIFSFKAHSSKIYTLTSTDQYLLSASRSDIFAWSWEEIINKNVTQPKFQIFLPASEDKLIKPEINCLISKKADEGWLLFGGCNDKQIYVWDVETNKLIKTLSGHTDYIHDIVSISNGNELITSSEDGSVKLWDIKSDKSEIYSFEPYKNPTLYRPKFGKWISCVNPDEREDWVVCGGGPKLSLWHLRTRSMTTIYEESPDFAAQTAFIYDDTIFAAGNQPFIYQWHFDGKTKARIPTSANSIYAMNVCQVGNTDVLISGGTSKELDVCSNFLYKDFALTLN